MASEQVLDIPVRRHVLTSERPFHVVLDGIYDGISQPDIGPLFAALAASTSYEELHRAGQAGAGQRWPDAVPAARRRPRIEVATGSRLASIRVPSDAVLPGTMTGSPLAPGSQPENQALNVVGH